MKLRMVSSLLILSLFLSSCGRNNVTDAVNGEGDIDKLIMPPNITVKINGEKIGTQLTSYNWNVYQNDDNSYFECADGSVKSIEKYYANKIPTGSKLTIESKYQPDHAALSIVDGSKFWEFSGEDNSFVLPDEKGIYLIGINCKWDTKGQASYIFKIDVN